jgi:hypothetical protein
VVDQSILQVVVVLVIKLIHQRLAQLTVALVAVGMVEIQVGLALLVLYIPVAGAGAVQD